MNNLVLVRVACALDRGFAGGVLRDVRQDDAHRFRFLFDMRERGGSFVVSLRPEHPWIGRPRGRWPGPTRMKHAFAGLCSRTLEGAVLSAVRKDPSDRILRLLFACGRSVVAELATHGANLVLLDPEGRVAGAARHPRRARERLRDGVAYAPPRLPARVLDPFASDAAAIDALLEAGVAQDEAPADVLRRRVFGLGKETVELLLHERRPEESPGDALVRRLADLTAGRADPVVEAPCDPLEAAESGTLERAACRLLPWTPD